LPADESEEAARNRADKRAWLGAHDYRVVEVSAAEVESNLAAALKRLAAALNAPA